MKILHESLRIFRKKGKWAPIGPILAFYTCVTGKTRVGYFLRKYFPQGVLWCKKPEREHGARQPLPLTAAVFFACAAMPRNRAKRDAKNSRSAERGCSSVLPPPNRRRMVGARNPAPPLAGYAAPYAAETSRYVPPLYTYPTKFMHNLCHIVM